MHETVVTGFDLSLGRVAARQIHLPRSTVTTRVEADDTPSAPHRSERHLAAISRHTWCHVGLTDCSAHRCIDDWLDRLLDSSA